MKIPKQVYICGQVFDVVQKKELSYDGEHLLGLCIPNECKIFIKKGLTKEKRVEVFIHECLHAIDENRNLKLGEKKVNTLGIEIIRFIRENKIDLLNY